jgi:hypothetical protein
LADLIYNLASKNQSSADIQELLPYNHPSAWTRDQVSCKEDVSVHLQSLHITALEAALDIAQSRQQVLENVTRDDFPLDTIADSVASWIEEIQEGKGLLVLRGLPIERFSQTQCEWIYWGLGCHIGTPQSQSLAGDRLGHVIDVGGKNPRYRAYENSTELALHTDASDIVAMMCLRQAGKGGLSGYASGPAIYNILLNEAPDTLDILCRGFRYHLFGEHEPGESPITEDNIPVFSTRDEYLSISYLRSYIEMAYAELGASQSSDEKHALDLLDKIAHGKTCCVQFMMEPGDIAYFNNYVVLHNRTAYFDSEQPEKRRHLLRLWLKAHTPRPVVDSIAAFGKRDGIKKQVGRTSFYDGNLDYREAKPPSP